ncbi:MAG: HAMP domain-containing protein [Saprospiraceae bacterium]|nr:HAMP domain-containing protein [Saprospiraceae bacterium]
MSLSFKNRIAFYYMMATAIILTVVFLTIYFAVQKTVMSHLDRDLSYEAIKHTKEILLSGDSIKFKNKAEWEEREHREIQVNPVFIQLLDRQGRYMDKSPNLKSDHLIFKEFDSDGHFETYLGDRPIRQVQMPFEHNGKINGYILAAMSSESELSILLKLRNVLLISFLVVLLGLYFIFRFLAGRSIQPVQDVTQTITRITNKNLSERVILPPNKDEIYELSYSFNALLQRLENAIERERQFTADASHELRTPLAALRGTMEVLIRKERTQKEYEDKIQLSLSIIERMTFTLEQLLLLARLDSKAITKKIDPISLPSIIDESLAYFIHQIQEKNIQIDLLYDRNKQFQVPNFYANLMIGNLLSNAIKYSNIDSTLKLSIEDIDNHVVCSIQDQGIGIKEEDLSHIYDNFFRSDSLKHKQITGNGLGLSIVKKCAEAINANVKIESRLGQGTNVQITFD